MGALAILADKIDAAIDEGRPGMGAVGGARLSAPMLAVSQARQLDALVTAMEGVVLAIRTVDAAVFPDRAPPIPTMVEPLALPVELAEKLARELGYAVSPDTMGDSVDVWWSSVPEEQRARFRRAVGNVWKALDGTVKQT